MTVILKVIAVSAGDGSFMPLPESVYLKSFDVDAHNGKGDAALTGDPYKALQFSSAADALKAWDTQSMVMPLRADGKPNKPLTAFTVELMTMEDPDDHHRI